MNFILIISVFKCVFFIKRIFNNLVFIGCVFVLWDLYFAIEVFSLIASFLNNLVVNLS